MLMPAKGRTLPPETTLAEYFDGVYSRMKLGGRSMHTKRLYAVTINNFDRFLNRPATLADLNDDAVTMLMSWLLENERSPRTANKHRDQVLAIWRYACRKRHIEADWPDVEPAAEFKRIPEAWTMEQFQALLKAAHETPGMIGEILARLYWPALLFTLYDTGARISALMQTEWHSVDLDRRTLLLRAETQKQRADQVLTLHGQSVDALRAIQKPERRLVFPWPHNPSYLWMHYKKLVERAGLAYSRMASFHKIRKTSATLLTAAVGSHAATKLLGHADAKTTAKYLDPRLLPDDATADNMPRPTMDVPQSKQTPGIDAKRLADLLPEYFALLGQYGIKPHWKCCTSVKRFVARSGIETVAELTPETLAVYLATVVDEVSAKTVQDYREGVTWFVLWLAEIHGCTRLFDCLAAIGSRTSHVRPPWRKLPKPGDAKGGAE
jgi:site-specific recombinase XerD